MESRASYETMEGSCYKTRGEWGDSAGREGERTWASWYGHRNEKGGERDLEFLKREGGGGRRGGDGCCVGRKDGLAWSEAECDPQEI